MRINIKYLYNFVALLLFCLCFFFETPLSKKGFLYISIFQAVACVCLFRIALLNFRRTNRKLKLYSFLLLWLAMLPFFAYGIFHGERNVFFRIVFGLLFCLLVERQTDWIEMLNRMLMLFSGGAVIFTYLFWLIPGLYRYVVDFYGYYPPGTGQLKYGYRAGFAAHYSQNGIFIAIFILMLVTSMLGDASIKKSIKNNRLMIALTAVSFLAFLLNGKRGTLVWCIVALLFTWFFSTENKTKYIPRIVIIVCVSLIALQLAIDHIPSLSFIVERFSTVGSDDASRVRFAMWALAFSYFLKSPIVGIGFLNFRELYSRYLFAYNNDWSRTPSYTRLDAHNVYIQVLCEMGIIGFTIYVLALIILFKYSIKLLRFYSTSSDSKLRYATRLSFCFQVFYLLYSLSGNCLYDMTFYIYVVAMAITCSLYYRMNYINEGDR